MLVKRTFLDAGVLVAAVHSDDTLHDAALAVLNDAGRDFLGTSMLELELSQAQYKNSYPDEAAYYLDYLSNVVTVRTDITEDLVSEGLVTVRLTGTTAADAMHLASALRMEADEFITTESKTKPMHRETRIPVVFLGDLS